jgi:hypothetical protein
VKDTAGKVIGASKIARDITERKQLQARQDLLAHEIQHRTRNLFAVVLAVVARSFVGKQTVKDAESAVLSRLHSLAETHAMLLGRDWQGADLGEVVRTEMKPYGDRVQTDGPSLVLTRTRLKTLLSHCMNLQPTPQNMVLCQIRPAAYILSGRWRNRTVRPTSPFAGTSAADRRCRGLRKGGSEVPCSNR